jgi:hypothetical protein
MIKKLVIITLIAVAGYYVYDYMMTVNKSAERNDGVLKKSEKALKEDDK